MPDLTGTITTHLPSTSSPGFDVATRTGAYIVERPFLPAYPSALIITAPMMQDVASYAPPARGSVNPDFPAAIWSRDSVPQDVGFGTYTFTRTWATKPPTRIVDGGTVVSTIPYIEVFSTATQRTTRLFRSVPCLELHEYFTTTDPSTITVLNPNTAIAINPTTGEITTTPAAGPGNAGSFAYLLEPSQIKNYEGDIYDRVSRYINGA